MAIFGLLYMTINNLRLAFEKFGQVESVTITKDKRSGKSKGFGSLEMASETDGHAAMEGLHGKECEDWGVQSNSTPLSSGTEGRSGSQAKEIL